MGCSAIGLWIIDLRIPQNHPDFSLQIPQRNESSKGGPKIDQKGSPSFLFYRSSNIRNTE